MNKKIEDLTMEDITIIISVITIILACLSLYQAIRSSKQSNENADRIAQISIQQIQSQAFSDFSSRYQEICKNLQNDAIKKWYQQRYLDLCRDEFVSNKLGNLPKEVWEMFVERMRLTVKQDPSFSTVWKGYAQAFEQDFVFFFDNEVWRKVGII